jgi:hypothetical protein
MRHFPRSLVDQLSGSLRPQFFRYIPEQTRFDVDPDRSSVRRGQQNYAICVGLIPKPAPWSDKDENKDEGDDDVVRPGSSREIPKSELSDDAAHRPA